ncbi:MAG: hypothetical protein IKW58_01485 [Alphaproteobacteria bacterium]|nr:hypothetical protein [Alphaproteobacteria bacterium]
MKYFMLVLMFIIAIMSGCSTLKSKKSSASEDVMRFEPDAPSMQALPDKPLLKVSQDLPIPGVKDTLS